MGRYYSYSEYLKNKFGSKLYKLSLSISNSCPNRDGKAGKGGCIFCSGGSGDFAASVSKPLSEQIAEAKKRVSHKNPSGKYVAYFQSYTSTYIPPQKLREHLSYVCSLPEIVAVSIATRADCLGDEIMDVLFEFSKKISLTVELGLQTSNEKTALLINRACPLCEFEVAIKKLKGIGAEVVLHIIFGLPFETEEDMLNTVRYVVKMGADGVKFQLLHVLEGTRLAEMYKNGDFETLSKEEYFGVVSKALEILPPQTVVHRLTGDGAKKLLISPMWSADKKKVMNDMNRFFEENNIVQGKNSEVK